MDRYRKGSFEQDMFFPPVYIGIEIFQQGIIYAWMCVLMFIISLFMVTSARYRQRKWEKMLVVEREVVA